MTEDQAKTEDQPKTHQAEEGTKADLPEIEEKESSKQLTAKFGGTKVSYTAKAATQVFEIKEAKASFFYVSYTRDEADPATRPILFCFNSGPGSSTVWLHLGLFGPKRMQFDEDGFKLGMTVRRRLPIRHLGQSLDGPPVACSAAHTGSTFDDVECQLGAP